MSAVADQPADLLPTLLGKRRSLRRELARVERAISAAEVHVSQIKERLDARTPTETRAA